MGALELVGINMKKYLIIVDVQNDFCPGGSLAVENGDKIIMNINKLSASEKFDIVIATQDWHPRNHISFAATHHWKEFVEIEVSYGIQMLWPKHCVAGTQGAEFRPSLWQEPIHYIIRKGYRKDVDSYSAFVENDRKTKTGLGDLIDCGADIYVVGIATDVCVVNTAMDALDYGNVYVVEDACAGVTSEGAEKAIMKMKRFDIHVVQTENVLRS